MSQVEGQERILEHVLENHCNINWFDDDSPKIIRSYLNRLSLPRHNERFRQELAEAILNHTITPEKYAQLTDDDSVEEPEEVERELRLLWQYIYGEEPVAVNVTI